MVAGDYTRGGTCGYGTPENPTCTESLTLNADGTGTYIGDDIVEDITWKQDGNRVIVAHRSRTFALDGWTRK